MLPSATCTSLRLTAARRDCTLKLLILGAKFRLDLLRSRKNALISVRNWMRRILPDGFSFSLPVYTAAERLADFRSTFFAVCTHSPRFAADFLHAVSLVLTCCLPRLSGREDCLRHLRVSPLFFSPV